jgi:BirA family biotin operon repressor/biotin-[acetyl-CoA-carboxylase] ligase
VSDPIGIARRKPDPAPSWTVWEVDETGSTNADLLAWVDAGRAADRWVLRAGHQSAGRGRLDRRWEAPPGANLLASVLFVEPPSIPARLTQAVSRAALDAIETIAARDLTDRLALKWPNDLLLDGRKLAGVLAQRSSRSGAVVVGLGLNVGWAPAGAASLAGDLGLAVEPAVLLDQVVRDLDRALRSEVTVEELAARSRERMSTLGSRVRVELPGGGVLVGTAIDLDADGRLLVDRDDGGGRDIVVVDVGDIVHLRPG